MSNGMIDSVYRDILIKPDVGYKVDADNETITGDEVDTLGYEGCAFLILLDQGEVKASALTVKVQQDTVTGMGSAADVEGTGDTADTAVGTDASILMDIKKPRERFLRIHATIANMNTAVPLRIIAILYNAVVVPVTQVVKSAELHVEPAEGTA